MNPLKQRTPGGDPGHDAKNKSAFNGEDYRHSINNPQVACPKCAFFELIRRKTGYVYGLCHFSGLHNPLPGQDGCHFLYGRWEDIDSILGLTQGNSINNLDFPNRTRQGNGLYSIPNTEKHIADKKVSAIHSPYAGNISKVENHISRCYTSSIREDWRLCTSRGACSPAFFAFNNPESYEV